VSAARRSSANRWSASRSLATRSRSSQSTPHGPSSSTAMGNGEHAVLTVAGGAMLTLLVLVALLFLHPGLVLMGALVLIVLRNSRKRRLERRAQRLTRRMLQSFTAEVD
jgi:Flp pilus assembly protein TadB